MKRKNVMLLFLLSIAVLVVGIVIGAVVIKKGKGQRVTSSGSYVQFDYRNTGVIVLVISILLSSVMMVASCITSVQTGHTGIVTTFGRVEDYTYEAGIHFKAPWKSVIEMDNRTQKASLHLPCFSADIQEVDVVYILNYQINKANAQLIYKTIGTDYYDVIIVPRVQEAVKSVIAKYSAEELLQKRSELSNQIRDILSEQLKNYNIELSDTSLENLDFTDAFTNAVEAKQVAAQNKLQAQIEQEQKTMEQEAAAERAIIDAKAQAEVARLKAEADLEVTKIEADATEYAGQKEAAKNRALSSSLTDELINYYYIQQWNGILPESYVGSDNVSAIVGMN
jgi:regulator of protease activity HflC (stomatin/prohibitin superfamily)